MAVRASRTLTLLFMVGLGACGGGGIGSVGGPQYEEYECPAPIGKIIREDCSKQALKYDGAAFSGQVGGAGVGASASYRDEAIRQADGLVQMLKEQRVGICNDFNTCKLSVPEYREETRRLDDSYFALLAVRDKMSALDARGAAYVLEEIHKIRRGQPAGGGALAPPPAPAPAATGAGGAPLAPTVSRAGALAGTYAITASANPGQPPGGGGYSGTVTIQPNGDAVMLTWQIGSGQQYQGIGLEVGGVLHVSWSTVDSKRIGIAVYPLENGRMNGLWTMTGTGGRLGTELLQGSPELSGEYQLVEGRFGDTNPYTGKVTLSPTGQTWAVNWAIGAESIDGVGVKVGNTFGVAYGVEKGQEVGIVSYTVQGNVLDGVWAMLGGSQLGRETLTRQ